MLCLIRLIYGTYIGEVKGQRKGFLQRCITTPPMSLSLTNIDSDVLRSVVEHIFLPPKPPQEAPAEEAERGTNVALCCILVHAATAFRQYLSLPQKIVWNRMLKMMEYIYRAAKAPLVEADLGVALSDLDVGGGLE